MSNIAFTALIKSKGYNQKRLAEETGIPPGVLSLRINGVNDWRWPEVSLICAALGITYDVCNLLSHFQHYKEKF